MTTRDDLLSRKVVFSVWVSELEGYMEAMSAVLLAILRALPANQVAGIKEQVARLLATLKSSDTPEDEDAKIKHESSIRLLETVYLRLENLPAEDDQADEGSKRKTVSRRILDSVSLLNLARNIKDHWPDS